MRPAFPRELVERDFRLRPVGEADDDRLLQHAQRAHLPGHAPATAAARRARRVDAWQIAAQLLIRRELVEETALQPPAVAEQTAVRERHVLRLRHLDGDRLELAEMRATAQLAPARADAVHDARGVARADLSHLDARPELAREIAHQLAEVHALLGAEVDRHPPCGRMDLDVEDLHRNAAAAREALCRRDAALLTLAPLTILAR